jgi:hypothetical protein
MTYDIIFGALPYSDLDHIYSAPAILKGIAVSNNYQAKTVDFGLVLLDLCDRNIDLFARVQSYFVSPGTSLTESELQILNKFYSQIVDYFKSTPTKYIAFSVLSVYTHKAIFDVTTRLKDNNINAKIVVGGRGAKVPVWANAGLDTKLTKFDKIIGYGEFLRKKKLVDHIVIGDGEDAILDLLKGNSNLTLNNVSETFEYPIPDYSDYKFDEYLFDNKESIPFPINGSKGCVRDCDFCDIKFQFGKYKYRTGTDIANEMIYVAEHLNFRNFQFTDSLVNGGLKQLTECCTIVAEYNLNNPDKRISWSGQYICRPETEMPKRLYKLMADSGAEGLTIGAESGSNNVLKLMNKKTTVEALYSELEQFREHGITCTLLTFVGHWSETFEDFIAHCRMFVNILPYVRSGTISNVTLGPLAMMLDGTPSMRDIEKHKIHLDDEIGNNLWISELNPDNNYKERVYRRLLITKLINQLKIPCSEEYNTLLSISSLIDLQHNRINDFNKTFDSKYVH